MNRQNLSNGYYQMDANESSAWGAYNGAGVDYQENARFRSSLKSELQEVANATRKAVEVFADGAHCNAQDWIVAIIEPED